MNRVYITRISSIHSIEGSANKQLAIVDGKQVVVPKGLFQPGDYCLYISENCLLPPKKQYSKCYTGLRLSTNKQGMQGYKVKRRKISNEISEGLILRWRDISELCDKNITQYVNCDLCDLLNIKPL